MSVYLFTCLVRVLLSSMSIAKVGSDVSWFSHHTTWPAGVSRNADIPGGLETFQAVLERPGVSPISGPRLPMTPLYKSLHGTAVFFLVSLLFLQPSPQLPRVDSISGWTITSCCSSTDLIKLNTCLVILCHRVLGVSSLSLNHGHNEFSGGV